MKSVLLVKFIFLGVAAGVFAHAAEDGRGWEKEVIRLSGAKSADQQKILDRLRRWPHLDEVLKAALSSERPFMAYDAISALKLKKWAPELRSKVKTDSTGFAIHALNAISGDQERVDLIRFYSGIWNSEGDLLAPPALMALVDTLGRLGARVDEGRWRAAMDHISEGVQISALNALRSWILYYGLNEGKDWLRNTDFSEKSGRSRKVCWLGQGLKVELLR
jgi:hypothetical protein